MYAYSPSKCSVIALVSLAAWMAPIQRSALAQDETSRPQDASEDIRSSRAAMCILRVSPTEPMTPLDEEFIQSILMTSDVRAEAVRDVLRRGGRALNENLNVSTEISIVGGSLSPDLEFAPVLYQLHVSIDEEDQEGTPLPPKAEELMSAIVERLRHALMSLSQSNLKTLRDAVAVSEHKLKEAQERLERLLAERKALSASVDRVNLDRELILNEIANLESQLREIEIERVANQARQGAIESQVAVASQRQFDRVKQDVILSEMAKLTEIQQARYDRLASLREKGNVSEMELTAAGEPLIEARIRMEERREAILSQDMGADRAIALNRELADASIAAAESEAR
ncbi:MAG: hypothetical protein KDA33_16200, partial [Phycisphaerales bacterium]|nr:hypothetical protein [Phycisphaerales bacterium]